MPPDRKRLDPQHSYLDFAAEGRGGARWYLAGTAIVLASWLVGGSVLSAAVWAVAALLTGQPLTDPLGGPPWLNTLFILSSFIPFAAAVLFVVPVIHQRPWRSVITPFTRISVPLIIRGAVTWLIALGLVTGAGYVLVDEGWEWTFTASAFWPLAVVVLTLTFIQTTAEELFFRGYLTQWVATKWRSIWLLAIFNGVFFMIPHLANPEFLQFSGTDLILAAVPYFAFGFLFAWVSYTSGTIELAIGAHFANNLIAFLFFSAPETPTEGGSLISVSEPSAVALAVSSLLSMVIFYLLNRRSVGRGEPLPQSGPKLPPPQWVPPAWYPDPSGVGQRYWDGRQWTGYWAP